MLRTITLLGLMLLLASSACADVKVEKVAYKGWPNSYRVANGEVELVVTGDVGPRIIRFGFVGGQNLSYAAETAFGKLPKIRLRRGRPTTFPSKSPSPPQA